MLKFWSIIRCNSVVSTVLSGIFIGAILGGIGGFFGCGCIDVNNIIKGAIIFGIIPILIAIFTIFVRPP